MTPSSAEREFHTDLGATRKKCARLGLTTATVAIAALSCMSACSSNAPGDGATTGGASSGGAASGGAVSAGGSAAGGSPPSATGGVAGAGGAVGSVGGAGTGGGAATGGSVSGGTGGASSGGSGSGGASTGGQSTGGPSAGCGTEFQNPPPDDEQQIVEIQGDSRYYLMDVPDGADNSEPLMLVFALHGFDMNNIAVVDLFNFTERSGGQAITVWPQGEGPHPGNVSHWGDGVLESTWSANAKNFEFLQRIMSDIGERYCIDQDRIFIAGFSMGGFFTNSIACEHPEWFRGFAPVAGGGPQNCGSSEPVAIMVQHGTADMIVYPETGEGSRDFWLTNNGCGDASTVSLNNCAFYEGCPEQAPVAWCTGNYDHYIPSEVAENAWSFFSSL